MTRTSGANFFVLTDPEPAVKAVARAISSQTEKPTSLRETPVGSHESNGHVERYFRTLHGQIRAVRLALQKAIGCEIDGDSAVMTWIIRHAAWLLQRSQFLARHHATHASACPRV